MTDIMEPTRPGEILLEYFIKPLGITSRELAVSIGVDDECIIEIISGDRPVSAETALRLSRRFGNSPEFWMNAQTDHDLEMAKNEVGNSLDWIELAPLIGKDGECRELTEAFFKNAKRGRPPKPKNEPK